MKQPRYNHLPNYAWATAGKYLGFMIGPGAKDNSWITPTAKYTQRLSEWPWAEMGLYLSMRVYNTFILPTLLFIAQLLHPPQTTLLQEDKAQKHIAAGPRSWCRMEDLQHLRPRSHDGSPITGTRSQIGHAPDCHLGKRTRRWHPVGKHATRAPDPTQQHNTPHEKCQAGRLAQKPHGHHSSQAHTRNAEAAWHRQNKHQTGPH